MSGYFLAFATNLNGAYLDGQAPPIQIEKGAIIDVRHGDDPYGAMEVLPKFVRVYVSDAQLSDLEGYGSAWRKLIDWSIANSDLTNDIHTISLFSTNPGVGGEGEISLPAAAGVLADYNCTVVSNTANNVVFTVDVYQSLISKGFWDLDAVGAITFTPVNYVQTGGVHTIQADYSKTGARPLNVDVRVRKNGGTIISHANKIITFSIPRSALNAALKDDLKKALESNVNKTRFVLSGAVIDAAVLNGGTHSMVLADLQAGMTDKSA